MDWQRVKKLCLTERDGWKFVHGNDSTSIEVIKFHTTHKQSDSSLIFVRKEKRKEDTNQSFMYVTLVVKPRVTKV